MATWLFILINGVSKIALHFKSVKNLIYTVNRAPRCNVTSDVGRPGTQLPRLLGLKAALFTLSNTRCYQADATWQPRMAVAWAEREREADDNLGSLFTNNKPGFLTNNNQLEILHFPT